MKRVKAEWEIEQDRMKKHIIDMVKGCNDLWLLERFESIIACVCEEGQEQK